MVIARSQGARVGWRRADDELALAIKRDDPAIESDVDLHPSTGIADPARAGRQLEDLAVHPDGVIGGHPATVLGSSTRGRVAGRVVVAAKPAPDRRPGRRSDD